MVSLLFIMNPQVDSLSFWGLVMFDKSLKIRVNCLNDDLSYINFQ